MNTWSMDGWGLSKATGVVCGEVLSSGCMKRALLLWHWQTKHASYTNKECIFFSSPSETSEYDTVFSSANKDNNNAHDTFHIARCD
jgi:hypothetical protein